MGNLKQYLPYILIGGLILFLLFRSRSSGGSPIISNALIPVDNRPATPTADPGAIFGAFQSLASFALGERQLEAQLEATRLGQETARFEISSRLKAEQIRANADINAANRAAADRAFDREQERMAIMQTASMARQAQIGQSISNVIGNLLGNLGGARTPPTFPSSRGFDFGFDFGF